MNFDTLTKYLKDNGFRRISAEGSNKWIYIDNNHSLQVTIEENKDELTAEDEERIKERLRQLGYLDD